MEYEIQVEDIVVRANETLNEDEAKAYIAYVKEKNPKKEIESIELNFVGDDVELGYHLYPEGFEKIRRITGYLVGTVDRFNNGKRAEVKDRVKHA